MRRTLRKFSTAQAPSDPSSLLTERGRPFEMVKRELDAVRHHITTLVTSRNNPILDEASRYVLAGSGKLLRPALLSLMAHAVIPQGDSERIMREDIGDLDDIETPGTIRRFLRLAEVTELIHNASLVHDDVIDDSPMRRGRPALHVNTGIKYSVLAGDFLLARASYWIATLNTPEIVILMTTALEDLTTGEIMQSEGCFDLDSYTKKSYCKTASLIANSLASAAVLAKQDRASVEAAKTYGKHLGIAFQIVDDCLDITGSESNLGKPKLADMKEGVATLPVLLAAQRDPAVNAAVRRRFKRDGDELLCVAALDRLGTVAAALKMADDHCRMAVEALSSFPPSKAKTCLEDAVRVVLTRQA